MSDHGADGQGKGAQQPGTPQPPGNPPILPDPEKPLPIEEPPRPQPVPVPRDEPPPMQALEERTRATRAFWR